MAIHILLTGASRGTGAATLAHVGGGARVRMVGRSTRDDGAGMIAADIPPGRIGLPAAVAEAVYSLSLDAPASMTGAAIDINGASYVR